MTERKGEVRPPVTGPDLAQDMVLHKGTRECPILQPHHRELCGIVQARERNRTEADRRRRESSSR
ncbi:MAG TPA: hypothetical protein VFZ26_04635 [Gemmatimonadales bacterium]